MGTSRKANFRLIRIPTPKSIRKFYAATILWMRANRPALQQLELTQLYRAWWQSLGPGANAVPEHGPSGPGNRGSTVASGDATDRECEGECFGEPDALIAHVRFFAVQEKLAMTAKPQGRVLPTPNHSISNQSGGARLTIKGKWPFETLS